MKELTKQDDNILSGTNRKKKPYVAMAITNLEMEVSSPILVGSVTSERVQVNNKVTVTEFGDDIAFQSDGFSADFDN